MPWRTGGKDQSEKVRKIHQPTRPLGGEGAEGKPIDNQPMTDRDKNISQHACREYLRPLLP